MIKRKTLNLTQNRAEINLIDRQNKVSHFENWYLKFKRWILPIILKNYWFQELSRHIISLEEEEIKRFKEWAVETIKE